MLPKSIYPTTPPSVRRASLLTARVLRSGEIRAHLWRRLSTELFEGALRAVSRARYVDECAGRSARPESQSRMERSRVGIPGPSLALRAFVALAGPLDLLVRALRGPLLTPTNCWPVSLGCLRPCAGYRPLCCRPRIDLRFPPVCRPGRPYRESSPPHGSAGHIHLSSCRSPCAP